MTSSKWRKVQDPVIGEASVPEVVLQFIAHTGITFGSYWLLGFEVAVLVGMLVGIALINLNILATAMSSNVHLAEIRDQLAQANSEHPEDAT